MKKWIALLSIILIATAGIVVYSTSNLSREHATATYSKSEERKGMNTLKVEAPYGYYVIRYDVVPRFPSNDQQPFQVGGYSFPNDPIGLYNSDSTDANYFPSKGRVDDIPVETHVRITSTLNPAATAEIPEEKAILERCGTYVFVTKSPVTHEGLQAMVSQWSIEANDDNN